MIYDGLMMTKNKRREERERKGCNIGGSNSVNLGETSGGVLMICPTKATYPQVLSLSNLLFFIYIYVYIFLFYNS